MSSVYCRKCSAINPDQAQFCSVCGASLSIRSDHPTLLMGPIEYAAPSVDAAATLPAGRAAAKNAAPPARSAEQGVVMPPGVAGPSSEAPTVAGPATYATVPGQLTHGHDVSPTTPVILARVAQATPHAARSGRNAQVGAPSNAMPIHYPRPGAIDSGRPVQKSFLASSRYFFIGTGFLLCIGIIALVMYPYLAKGRLPGGPGTTAAYARPASGPTPGVQATAKPAPTPVVTQPTTVYTNTSQVPTPTVTVQPATTCLHVDKTALSFSSTVGGNVPAAQTLVVRETCATGRWSVRWDAAWLRATPAATSTADGATPVTVSVSTANLAANTYTDHLFFDLGASQVKVAVTLTIAPPAVVLTPCIKLDQSNLSFNATAQQDPASQALLVSNCGSAGTVTATVASSYTSSPASSPGQTPTPLAHNNGTGWLTTSQGGQLAGGGSLPIHVSVNSLTPPLAPGVYTSSIAITITTSDGKADTHTVSVTLTVAA